MKRLFISILSLLIITSNAAPLIAQNKQKEKFNFWGIFEKKENKVKKEKTPKKGSKKDLINQNYQLNFEKDSLLRVIDSLQMDIKSYEEITLSDSLSIASNDISEAEYTPSDSLTLEDTDSLMSIWYHQGNMELLENMEKDIDLDTAFLLSNIPMLSR